VLFSKRKRRLCRRYTKATAVQASSDGALMSAEPSTEILGRLLCSGLRRRHWSTFTLRQSTSLDCTEAHSVAGPSLSGADDLDRTARRSPRPVAQCR